LDPINSGNNQSLFHLVEVFKLVKFEFFFIKVKPVKIEFISNYLSLYDIDKQRLVKTLGITSSSSFLHMRREVENSRIFLLEISCVEACTMFEEISKYIEGNYGGTNI